MKEYSIKECLEKCGNTELPQEEFTIWWGRYIEAYKKLVNKEKENSEQLRETH